MQGQGRRRGEGGLWGPGLVLKPLKGRRLQGFGEAAGGGRKRWLSRRLIKPPEVFFLPHIHNAQTQTKRKQAEQAGN